MIFKLPNQTGSGFLWHGFDQDPVVLVGSGCGQRFSKLFQIRSQSTDSKSF